MDYTELIRGAYDLHVHSAPDIMPRRLDDIDMAGRLQGSGIAGYAIKSHFFCTSERAQLMQRIYPEVEFIGTLTLNSALGGLNPAAIEMAARSGVRLVWFPTWNNSHDRDHAFQGDPGKQHYWVRVVRELQEAGVEVPAISCLDENGELKKEVLDILDIIAKYDIILATGHISHQEAYKLVPEAAGRGVKNIIITHVDWPGTYYSIEDQKMFAGYGAKMEHCYHTLTGGKCTLETTVEQIRAMGPENCLLSTDLGQKTDVYPEEGLLQFASRLYDAGFTAGEIRTMTVTNPRRLLGKE